MLKRIVLLFIFGMLGCVPLDGMTVKDMGEKISSESKSLKDPQSYRPHNRGALDLRYKWPIVNGSRQIPYVIEKSSAPDQSSIKKAMQHWTTNVPCINFVARTTQKDYISFFKGQGCYSWFGRSGGSQRISIGSGCAVMGTLVEEIGLALGFKFGKSLSPKEIEQARLSYCPGTTACSSLYKDTDINCQAWASLAYCDNSTYKDYMNANCKKSCLCRACEDKKANCHAYVKLGFCTSFKYKATMSVECRKACKLCS